MNDNDETETLVVRVVLGAVVAVAVTILISLILGYQLASMFLAVYLATYFLSGTVEFLTPQVSHRICLVSISGFLLMSVLSGFMIGVILGTALLIWELVTS